MNDDVSFKETMKKTVTKGVVQLGLNEADMFKSSSILIYSRTDQSIYTAS